ncbi:hypothetical protein, partial [Bifidobacterium pseudolongum]|uniref:hypothetical protein n=2 Tax=Bifidobacterium TaxID=1678 RepID=UPI0013EBC15E
THDQITQKPARSGNTADHAEKPLLTLLKNTAHNAERKLLKHSCAPRRVLGEYPRLRCAPNGMTAGFFFT